MTNRQAKFISLRWRVTLPLFVLILVIVMVGIYVLAASTQLIFSDSTGNILQQSARTVSRQIATLQQDQQRIAQTLAFVSGVPQAVRSGSADNVRSALESRAASAGLDIVALAGDNGQLILGLVRGRDSRTYERISVLDTTLASAESAISGLINTANDNYLVTVLPVTMNMIPVGHLFVGQRLPAVLENLNPSSMTDSVFYTAQGSAVGSTLDLGLAQFDNLPATIEQTTALNIAGQSYRALDVSFDYGEQSLGTLRLLVADDSPQTAALARQMGGLMLALLGAIAVIVLFISSHWSLRRTEQVQQTTDALIRGEYSARTNMAPVDEIGRLGQSLDRYADSVQQRQDSLQHSLRRQRRENERLTAIIESLPDGVIVQDMDGQVLLLNEKARELLGSTRVLSTNADLHALISRDDYRLGPALAPGLFALGEAQRLKIGQRTLSAQAAAVMTVTRQHLGTVIVVRDITEEIEREAARKRAIQELADEAHDPLMHLVPAARQYPAQDFSREIERHTGTLQRMILALRDLSDAHPDKQADQQRPILLDSLVWAIANEWRQVAQAQNLTFHVMIDKSGQYVLGQERRLRWAIGNVIDNAIKYTLSGGDLTLEIQDVDSDDYAYLRVRDNGVGIPRHELEHVMTRFYRGKPTTPDGQSIRVPGSGQGLYMANQIFEAHGGSIEIKSKPGTGTAVYFVLPLTAEQGYELPRFNTQFEGETLPIQRDDSSPEA